MKEEELLDYYDEGRQILNVVLLVGSEPFIAPPIEVSDACERHTQTMSQAVSTLDHDLWFVLYETKSGSNVLRIHLER